MKLQVGVKILIEYQGRYLFLRRAQSFQSGPQKWDIPGGRIEPEESLEEALAREVKEETGLVVDKVDKIISAQDIFVKDAGVHVVRLTYLGTASGDIKISDEHDGFRWMARDEVLTEPHVDSYLRQVLDGKTHSV